MRWIDTPTLAARAALLLLALCPAASQAQAPAPPAPVALPGAPPPAMPAATPAQVQPRFSVLIDAAHGEPDVGARITDRILEKDLVLWISVRLRSILAARGITVLTTRETDNDIPPRQRAEIANHAAPAACILMHATATGNGVHLYTSSLSQTAPTRFLPWQTAQSAFVTQSLRLSSELNSVLVRDSIPVLLGRTSLVPMDNMACPAVAVEIAPLSTKANRAQSLNDPAYQRRLIDDLAAAIVQWREDWRQQP